MNDKPFAGFSAKEQELFRARFNEIKVLMPLLREARRAAVDAPPELQPQKQLDLLAHLPQMIAAIDAVATVQTLFLKEYTKRFSPDT